MIQVERIDYTVWKGLADECSERTYVSHACQRLEQANYSLTMLSRGIQSEAVLWVGLETEHWTCLCELRARDQGPVESTDKITISN